VSVTVPVRRLPHAQGLPLPRYESDGAAGLDLLAALPETAPIVMEKLARALVPTGIVLQLPSWYEAQIRPRSGLALKHGVTVMNAPGTIDADYRGEIQVLLVNLGAEAFVVTRGMRIAQLIVTPVTRALLVETEELDSTERGGGGFGSTGVS
jgi:dUTP pyrophosphatase